MQFFMFKTAFSNGRPDFSDLVIADNEADAERKATTICQGISDEYRCDPDVEVEIVGRLARNESENHNPTDEAG